MTDDAGSRGQRVVVRSRLPGQTGPSGGPAMTDALGYLEHADATHVVVRRKDGSTTSIDRCDIVAIKRVPPPPERR